MYILVLFMPLLSAIVSGFFGRPIGDKGDRCINVWLYEVLVWLSLVVFIMRQF